MSDEETAGYQAISLDDLMSRPYVESLADGVSVFGVRFSTTGDQIFTGLILSSGNLRVRFATRHEAFIRWLRAVADDLEKNPSNPGPRDVEGFGDGCSEFLMTAMTPNIGVYDLRNDNKKVN